nr:disintegrin and metalloproteinase domain-containing protein 20-like [Cavia porcellus]
MGPSRAQNLLTGALCLSVFSAVLSPVCCSHDPPTWHFTSSEVVIPRKVPHKMDGSKTPEQLSYTMRFRGQRHVIHMKLKKNLLPKDFMVATNNDQGAIQEDYPFVPRNCYYSSYLEGVPGSTATLDTCSGGLRGMLQLDDFTYEIKPLAASSKFEHIVSLLVAQYVSEKDKKCDIPEDEADQLLEEVKLVESSRSAPVYLWRIHRKQIHVHYTISNSLWAQDQNQSRVVEKIVIINNINHSIFRPMGLNVFVRMVCIWSGGDQVNGIRTTSFRSAILTGHSIGTFNYYANRDGMCNPNWGVLYLFMSRYHIFMSAAILAHAMGHSINMHHDSEGCVCFRRSHCLMSPTPGFFDTASNCSFTEVHRRIHSWDVCLSRMFVPYNNFPYVAPRCGDKIVNNNEDCDCGTLKACASSKCCTTDCVFTAGSVCNSGECCVKCEYALPGVICRDTLGICDLPEYCSGKNESCPHDFYIQDGTPCSPQAVCMHGNCSDRDLQCQALFGYEVKDAPKLCYEKLNIIGDRFGNCGLREQRPGVIPSKCDADNVLCGILHCSSPGIVPGGGEHTTFHDIIIQDVKQEHCFGYDVHLGTEIPEMGLVVDGATCGPGRFCRKQNCTFHDDMGFDCDVKSCNFRGVCNNLKHCHCARGYNPPNCSGRGLGGSVDSGPPPTREEGIRARIIFAVNETLLLIIVRFGLLLAAMVIGGCIRAKRAVEKKVYQEEYEESESESSD